jgi:hypothetical protein
MAPSTSKDGKLDIIYSFDISLKILSIYLSVIPQGELESISTDIAMWKCSLERYYDDANFTRMTAF